MARSGLAQPLHPFIALDPTCKPLAKVQISILDAPRNGRVTVVNGTDFATFAPANPRSRCNTRKFPSQRLTYTSAPGYVGEDEFTIEIVDELGTPIRRRFHIVVR